MENEVLDSGIWDKVKYLHFRIKNAPRSLVQNSISITHKTGNEQQFENTVSAAEAILSWQILGCVTKPPGFYATSVPHRRGSNESWVFMDFVTLYSKQLTQLLVFILLHVNLLSSSVDATWQILGLSVLVGLISFYALGRIFLKALIWSLPPGKTCTEFSKKWSHSI